HPSLLLPYTTLFRSIVEIDHEGGLLAMLGLAEDAQGHLEHGVVHPFRLGADIDRDLRRAVHAEGARRHRMLEGKILGVLGVKAEARRGIGVALLRITLGRNGSIGHDRRSLAVRRGSTRSGNGNAEWIGAARP